MQTISGTFVGRIEPQGTVQVGDRENHQMLLVQVRGPQASPDPNWDKATITYSAVIDLMAGHGMQRGYFVNVHVDGDRDWGTFEGAITTVGTELHCEGTWAFTGGSGRYQRISGKGSFSMRMPSPEVVQTSWEGAYESGMVPAGRT
jgi:hypothetical protein